GARRHPRRPDMTRARLTAASVLLCVAGAAGPARAQGGAGALAARVDGAPAGHVQFRFAARAGVCGNGRTYIQTAPGSFNGSFSTSIDETLRVEPCQPGPVRVLLD